MTKNSILKRCTQCFGLLDEKSRCAVCGKKESSSQIAGELPPHTLLADRYYIAKRLGRGGFGITYSAFRIDSGKRFAVKEFFPAPLKRAADGVTAAPGYEYKFDFGKGLNRFMEEARTLASIKSLPGAVKVADFFSENGTAYIVTEFLDGDTLKNYIKKAKKLTLAKTTEILFPVFDSLGKLHDMGIVHRDISTDNIILTQSGAVLIDYGAATHGQIPGVSVIKHSFAPPEQYKRGIAVDRRSDIYSLAVTVYCCITGKLPPEAISRINKDSLITPAKYAKITPAQEAALLKALSVDPGLRHASVAEFYAGLTGEGTANAIHIGE